MKTTRFTNEQIIGFLKQAEAGMSIKELCISVRHGHGVTDAVVTSQVDPKTVSTELVMHIPTVTP